jgi:hypothetical protein
MPKFSHQHYDVLAKVFNDTRDKCGSDWAVIRSTLHEVLAKDNPKFSHTRFINACYSGTAAERELNEDEPELRNRYAGEYEARRD